MATENLIIIVKDKGAQAAADRIKNVGKGAQGSAAAVTLLKRALVALGGVAAIRQLVALTDTFTNIQNRLKLVTTGTAQLNVVTGELLKISNRTRSSFEGSAQLFARTARATRDLGVSQKDVLQFTESLNQAVILSGASAVEAEQGIRQLSQGLGKGRLDGDELRSVLENLSFVGDILAEKMGVARGALRDLGAQGAITPQVILGAFQAAREELEERFAKTVPTIGQSFQVLQNQVVALTGAFNQQTGIAGILSKTILGLANNIETVARVLGAAGLLGVLIAVRFAVDVLIARFGVFRKLILANPLAALAKALLVVGALAVAFADKITVSSDGLTTLADVFAATFNVVSDLTSETIVLITALTALFPAASQEATGFGNVFTGVLTNIIRILDKFIGIFAGLILGFINGLTSIPKALTILFESGFSSITGIVKEAVNEIITVLNTIGGVAGIGPIGLFELSGVERNAVNAFENIGNNVKEGFLAGLNANLIESTITRITGEVGGVTQERLGAEIVKKASEEFALSQLGEAGEVTKRAGTKKTKGKTFTDVLRELEQENELLQLNSIEREKQAALFQAEQTLKRSLTDTEREQLDALLDTNRALATRAEILDEIQAPQIELQQGQEALNTLFKEGEITVTQYTQKLRQLQLAALQTDTTLEGGLKRGLLSIGEEFTNLSTMVEGTLVNAFQGAEDALVEFAQTGKLSIKDLVDSIFADLARLAVRSAITGPIAGFLSQQVAGGPPGQQAGGGGIFGSLGALFGPSAPSAPAAGAGGTGSAGGINTLSGLAALGATLGFQNGGGFTVGGAGGPDSQLVTFRATPGEEVKINKPGRAGGEGMNIVFNISTPDADSFRRDQGKILAKTQASLSRQNSRNN